MKLVSKVNYLDDYGTQRLTLGKIYECNQYVSKFIYFTDDTGDHYMVNERYFDKLEDIRNDKLNKLGI